MFKEIMIIIYALAASYKLPLGVPLNIGEIHYYLTFCKSQS